MAEKFTETFLSRLLTDIESQVAELAKLQTRIRQEQLLLDQKIKELRNLESVTSVKIERSILPDRSMNFIEPANKQDDEANSENHL